MTRASSTSGSAVADRFAAFVTERYPFAIETARAAFAAAGGGSALSAAEIEAVRGRFGAELRARLHPLTPAEVEETTPGVTVRDGSPRRSTSWPTPAMAFCAAPRSARR
jgi:hypothetical protein